MADEENTSNGPSPEEQLSKALTDFQTKADEHIKTLDAAIAEINKRKAELIDGSEGQPSVAQQLTEARDGAKKLAEEIGAFHASLNDPAKNDGKAVVVEVPEFVVAIRDAKSRVEKLEAAIKGYEEVLLGKKEGDKEVPGIKQEVEKNVKELQELHSKIFDKPAEDRLPLSKEVGQFLEDFKQKKKDLESIRADIIAYQDELLGKVQEDGKRTGGIREELENESEAHTEEYEAQDRRQRELMDRVDALLAGASTAALGKAFNLHKTSFDDSNKKWMQVFVGAVTLIIAVPVLGFIWPTMLQLPWWEQLLVRLPIIGGAITLAWYASKQRSQNRRLQQEYAYKEDVAMIYIALKKEIEDLGENPLSAKLKEQVLQVLVNSVGYNPSETLDSVAHDDKGPAHEAYKKGMDAVTDIVKEVVPKIVKAGN